MTKDDSSNGICERTKPVRPSVCTLLRDVRFEDYDVMIDIHYCGLSAASDIHQVRNEWGASTFPMVPGHEIAGVVTGIGAKVTRHKMGDRVAIGCFVDSCRKCGPCLNGLEQYCAEGPTLTYNAVERDGKNRTQGGYSNKIVVDENYVLRIPDISLIGSAQSAPLRWYHSIFASYTLESRSWKESRYYRSRRLGTHGSKNRSCTGAEVTVPVLLA